MTESIAAAEAPANIALIKYMGKHIAKKIGDGRNRPVNASLSYTLDHLRTRVEIMSSMASIDEWQPLQKPGWSEVQLSDTGRQRFLTHFNFLKQKLGLRGHYVVRSANNFPSDCGVASSASSFAALTMATYEAAQKANAVLDITWSQLADLSRVGSGSSIRSFFGPFALWNEAGCSAWPDGPKNMLHQTVIVTAEKKAVSSSSAHEQVNSSLLFIGRPERAEHRLADLLKVLAKGCSSEAGHIDAWRAAYDIVWAEFWDMHALFHTSQPPFQYMNSHTMMILEEVQLHWQINGDGPLVTLDAGPNVHLLYRLEQKQMAQELAKKIQNLNLGAQILLSSEFAAAGVPI